MYNVQVRFKIQSVVWDKPATNLNYTMGYTIRTILTKIHNSTTIRIPYFNQIVEQRKKWSKRKGQSKNCDEAILDHYKLIYIYWIRKLCLCKEIISN